MQKVVELFKSRKFWAVIVALFFVVMLAIDPAFPLEEEQVISIVALTSAYVIGVAVEGGWREFGDVKSKLLGLLQSRKFWAAGVGLLITMITAFKPDFPITSDQLLALVIPLVSYIMGVAIEDRAKQG